MVFRCPNSQAHYNEAVIYLNCGTPKNNEFSIWNKWKIYYFLVSQYLSTLGYSESQFLRDPAQNGRGVVMRKKYSIDFDFDKLLFTHEIFKLKVTVFLKFKE